MSAFVAPPAFALAKIQPPKLRTDLVERGVLELALQGALQSQRLVLLLAPAGYGKTVALAPQIRKLPADCSLAWISADENDHLPCRGRATRSALAHGARRAGHAGAVRAWAA